MSIPLSASNSAGTCPQSAFMSPVILVPRRQHRITRGHDRDVIHLAQAARPWRAPHLPCGQQLVHHRGLVPFLVASALRSCCLGSASPFWKMMLASASPVRGWPMHGLRLLWSSGSSPRKPCSQSVALNLRALQNGGDQFLLMAPEFPLPHLDLPRSNSAPSTSASAVTCCSMMFVCNS